MFENKRVELGGDRLQVNNVFSLYEGVLVDEPATSRVSGTIIDGVFYGTIESDADGKYFIESARRYNQTLDAHSIMYHEDDINLDAEHHVKKRSLNADDHLSCGSSKTNVKEWLRDEQKKLYEEKRKLNVSIWILNIFILFFHMGGV